MSASEFGWIFDRPEIEMLSSKGATGQGITVAVIDPSPLFLEHSPVQSKSIPVYNPSGLRSGLHPYHGTQMCSLIAGNGKASGVQGVAPESNLLYGRFSTDDHGTLVSALAWARNNGAHIMSLSLQELKFSSAVQEEITKNPSLFYVVASGNNFVDEARVPRESFPACYENVIVVGAHDSQDVPWTNSYRNKNLAFLAPGVDVRKPSLTTAIGGGTPTYDTNPGTSDACALVSGLLASILSGLQISARRPVTPALKEKIMEVIAKTCRATNGTYPANKIGRGTFAPLSVLTDMRLHLGIS